MPAMRDCGFEYQEGGGAGQPGCSFPGCGMFAVGKCVDCDVTFCGLHLPGHGGRTLCAGCRDKVVAEESLVRQSAVELRAADLRRQVEALSSSSYADVEAAVRALGSETTTSLAKIGVEVPTHEQIVAAFGTLLPGSGRPPKADLVHLETEKRWRRFIPHVIDREPAWRYSRFTPESSGTNEREWWRYLAASGFVVTPCTVGGGGTSLSGTSGPWRRDSLYIVGLDFDPAVAPASSYFAADTFSYRPPPAVRHLHDWLQDMARLDMEKLDGTDAYQSPPWQEQPSKVFRDVWPGDI